MLFASNQEINDFTSSSDYTFDGKNLCFAVVIGKNNVDNKYEYFLRWNVSGYEEPDIPNPNDEENRITQLKK